MHKLTNDRMKWGRGALLAGVALALVHLVPPFLWLRLPGAVVSLDGKPDASAAVYRSSDGQLLVWTKKLESIPYVIDPAGSDVGPVCYESLLDENPDTSHILFSAWFALVTDDGYHPGALRSYYEGDRHAIVHPGDVEFGEEYLPRATGKLCARRVRVRF